MPFFTNGMRLEESYANALFESLNGKTSAQADSVVENFFSVVSKKGHMTLFPRIAKAFERVYLSHKARKMIKIFVSEAEKEIIPKDTVLMFSDGAEEIPVCEFYQDSTIIGGYVAKGRGLRVDASYKTSLLSLYSKIKA